MSFLITLVLLWYTLTMIPSKAAPVPLDNSVTPRSQLTARGTLVSSLHPETHRRRQWALQMATFIGIQMSLSENSVPLHPMVLLIIIPTKWLLHWGYTPFSDIPRWRFHEVSKMVDPQVTTGFDTKIFKWSILGWFGGTHFFWKTPDN